ncbi:hypothetical protein D3C72_2085250 [compost metagenome]
MVAVFALTAVVILVDLPVADPCADDQVQRVGKRETHHGVAAGLLRVGGVTGCAGACPDRLRNVVHAPVH